MSKSLARMKGTPARIMAPRLVLIATVAILSLLGLVMIYSASSIKSLNDFGDSAYYLKLQAKYLVIGIVCAVVAAKLPYRVYRGRFTLLAWLLIVGLLLLTAVMGSIGLGAKRWLTIAGQSFQPSEFAKIVVILVLSMMVCRYRSGEFPFKKFLWKSLLFVALPLLLIVLQPDLGTTIIASIGVLVILFLGEFPVRYLLQAIGAVAAIGVVAIVIEPYRLARVVSALDPWLDPLGDGYQVIQSFYAFGSGGLTGVGLGLSRQKFSYLPEAHTDFIFAIIGEELGLIGALSVLALFVVFVWAGIQIARNAPDLLGRLIAGSATALIGFQALLNMACVVGLFPITGKPLPFLSYGGTSVLSTLILVGLILSVSLHSDVPDKNERRRGALKVIDGGAKDDGYDEILDGPRRGSKSGARSASEVGHKDQKRNTNRGAGNSSRSRR